MVMNVAVVGAGVVGLSTAVSIQTSFPGAKVTVIADKVGEDTTSYGSGGIFLPTIEAHPVDNAKKLRQIARDSWSFYQQLGTSPEAGLAGAIILTGYKVTKTEYADPLYKDIVFSYRKLSDNELEKLGVNQDYKHGYQITTIVLNQEKYLPWLTDKILQNGGRIQKRKLRSLEELVGSYDLLVNCCGLGNKDLVGDKKVFPIRGHLLKVSAPWIKHWFYTDDVTYVIPGETFVNLGGLKQDGKDSLKIDPGESKDILKRCGDAFPFVKASKIQREWVGLRPGRSGLRIESEEMSFPSGRLKCIHNYGHGANGVALSWGSAVEVIRLIKSSLSSKL